MFGLGTVKKVFEFLGKLVGLKEHAMDIDLEKYREDGKILDSALEASLQVEKLRLELALASQSNWLTRWIRPAFAFPMVAYIWAIVIDSIFIHENFVREVPDAISEWFMIIITFYFGGRVIEKVADKVLNRR